MIKLMIHTTVSKRDSSGNVYSVTSYYTPASRHPFLTTGREWGGGSNAHHFAVSAGLSHEEIHETRNDEVPIREFNRLADRIHADSPHFSGDQVTKVIADKVQTEQVAA